METVETTLIRFGRFSRGVFHIGELRYNEDGIGVGHRTACGYDVPGACLVTARPEVVSQIGRVCKRCQRIGL